MNLLWKILKVVTIVTGFAATYGSLAADAWGVDMWGLEWQYWTMIGFTIFWISLAVVIWQLHSENRRLNNGDAKLERCKRKLEIEELKAKASSRETIQAFGTDALQAQTRLEGTDAKENRKHDL